MDKRIGKGFEEYEWKAGEDPMDNAEFREGMKRHAAFLQSQGIGSDDEHQALIEAVDGYPTSPDARSAAKRDQAE